MDREEKGFTPQTHSKYFQNISFFCLLPSMSMYGWGRLQGRWLSSVVIHPEPCDGEDPKAKSVDHLTDERKESTNAQQRRYSSRLGENSV